MHIVQVMANAAGVPYFNWMAELSKDDPDVRFTFVAVYSERPRMLDEMKERGSECYWIKFNPAGRPWVYIRVFFQLWRLFLKLKPDGVHTHLFDDSLPGLLAARLAGVKSRVITKQDTWFHFRNNPHMMKWDRFNNGNATTVHAVAARNRDFVLTKEGVPEDKLVMVRNGFSYKEVTASSQKDIKELRERFKMDGRFVIGTVARYIPWKGHELIIHAAESLSKKYDDLLFLWPGYGSEAYIGNLREMIRSKMLQDTIIITGYLDRPQMPSLYRCLDMFLHTAIEEPFGFSIAEALMNQVPVAATPTGSTDLITHMKEAWILEENSVPQITEAVDFFYQNPEKSAQIGAAGHQHALDNLTFDKMYKGHVDMYIKDLQR